MGITKVLTKTFIFFLRRLSLTWGAKFNHLRNEIAFAT